MSTTLKTVYNSGQVVSFGSWLTNLSNGQAAQSAVIDNSTTKAVDYVVDGYVKTNTGGFGTNPVVNILVGASFDGVNFGGSWGSNVIGSGQSLYSMPSNISDFGLLTVKPGISGGYVEYFNGNSISSLFNGVCPQKFVMVVQNLTGLTLASGQLTATPIFYEQV